MADNYTPEPKWGTIEEKDSNGNILSVKEGLVIGRGENKRVVSPKDVEAMSATHATYKELAEYYGVKENTFRDHFRENVIKGRANTKINLRKWQLEAASKGNATMLIWLGKQMLGQSDSNINSDIKKPLPLGNDIPEELTEQN
jgi:hypothetical protein